MKYNKANIMTKANNLRNVYGLTKSESLRKAWAMAKLEIVEKEVFYLNMANTLSYSDQNRLSDMKHSIESLQACIYPKVLRDFGTFTWECYDVTAYAAA